jgi:hypothetical protein
MSWCAAHDAVAKKDVVRLLPRLSRPLMRPASQRAGSQLAIARALAWSGTVVITQQRAINI